uniref:Transposase n=1 Tax=Haemonchus placei TaxID=6290 RepID=A0A0N4WGP1_HAEPC
LPKSSKQHSKSLNGRRNGIRWEKVVNSNGGYIIG